MFLEANCYEFLSFFRFRLTINKDPGILLRPLQISLPTLHLMWPKYILCQGIYFSFNILGFKGRINCPKLCRPRGHREGREKQRGKLLVVSWDPTVRQGVTSWSKKIILSDIALKKKFLGITLCSEN